MLGSRHSYLVHMSCEFGKHEMLGGYEPPRASLFQQYIWLEYTTLVITECNEIRKFAIKLCIIHSRVHYQLSVTDLQVGADHMTFSQPGVGQVYNCALIL